MTQALKNSTTDSNRKALPAISNEELRAIKKQAQISGWLLSKSTSKPFVLKCSKIGCPGSLIPSNGTGIPPCRLPHSNRYSASTFARYRELIGTFRTRRVALGLSQTDIDHAAGLSDGHTAKIESYVRVPTWETLNLLSSTLGMELELRGYVVPLG